MRADSLIRYGVGPFGFLLKWLLALQACRFFVEARRTGGLEMLLGTPLTTREILGGQTLALRRSFLGPAVAMLALLFVPAVVQACTAPTWHAQEMATAFFECVAACFYCVRLYADCYAITWFGMWLALTLKRPGLAPSLTIFFVLILPSVLCWLDVFADLFFILWGVIKLRQEDLRFVLARQYQPARAVALARTAAATPGLPPVIAG